MSISMICDGCKAESSKGGVLTHKLGCFAKKPEVMYHHTMPSITLKFDSKKEQEEFHRNLTNDSNMKPSDSATPKSDDKSPSTPTSTDTNTSFKEELREILEKVTYHKEPPFTEFDESIRYTLTKEEALTSITNLVDKEVIAELESIRVQQNSHNLDESCCVLCDRIDKKRAIIRGNDEQNS